MFERYTEKARRVIFFARHEASQFGSPSIETEHILLGLLREDKALTNRFLRSPASVESIRKQVEAHTTIGEKVSTSVDLPLSNECKRVLAYAAEEAERLSHKHIGTEHLLLGLLREEKCFAAEMLRERGVRLASIREQLARTTQGIPDGYHSVQPYLMFDEAAKAIEFYKNAFGASERLCMKKKDGRVGHAEIQIGDSCIMMADESAEMDAFPPVHFGGSPVSLLIYTEDCDAMYRQALEAGAKSVREPADQPYGDRMAGVLDPFGYKWWIGTHIKDLSKEELETPY